MIYCANSYEINHQFFAWRRKIYLSFLNASGRFSRQFMLTVSCPRTRRSQNYDDDDQNQCDETNVGSFIFPTHFLSLQQWLSNLSIREKQRNLWEEKLIQSDCQKILVKLTYWHISKKLERKLFEMKFIDFVVRFKSSAH